MKTTPVPSNEDLRLQDLYNLGILDTDPEKDYNDLVELTAQICNCPIASITFLDKERQWFKAVKNLDIKEGRRDISFCSHTIYQNETMVVCDTSKDERFVDNPYVKEMNVGFYAGAPILSAGGFPVGTVCTIDDHPKTLSESQIAALDIIAKQVSRLLELRTKNKEMIRVAEQLIEAEKKLACVNLASREKENFKTATVLHEDIAQTTAAVKLNIGFAKNNMDIADHFLESSIKELDKLTHKITDLSKSITPTTLTSDDYGNYVINLVNKFTDKEKIEVDLTGCNAEGRLKGEFGLMVFRTVEDLLALIKANKPQTARLAINCEETVLITLEFAPAHQLEENERMLMSNLENRMLAINGSIEITNSMMNAQVFINIPYPIHARLKSVA